MRRSISSAQLRRARRKLSLGFLLLFLASCLWFSTAKHHAAELHNYTSPFLNIFIVSTTNREGHHLQMLLSQLQTAGLVNRVQVFSSARDKNGHRGCWRAHAKIAKRAVRLGLKSVLVFEEDAVLQQDFVLNWRKYSKVAASLPRYDVLFLSHNPEQMLIGKEYARVDSDGLGAVRVKSWSTVAYIIQGEALLRLAKTPFTKLPGGTVDGILHESKSAWAFYPMPVLHPDNWSDTVHSVRHLKWGNQERMLYNLAFACNTSAAKIENMETFAQGQGCIVCCDPF